MAHIAKSEAFEIWLQDEMRLGQKNGLVRRWARRGSRPRQPAAQRYGNATLFGAICPALGLGAALAMPHAVLLLDRAGWHTTGHLVVTSNMTLIFLPSRAPELNPPELVEGREHLGPVVA